MAVSVLYVSGRNRDRSPAAEIITNHVAKQNGLEVEACSAGLYKYPYGAMSLEMAVALGNMGYKVSPAQHTSRMLTGQLLEGAKPDLVLCMEESEKEYVLSDLELALAYPGIEGKTHTIAAYAGLKDEDIRIRERMRKMFGYELIDLLPYILRWPIYKIIGTVEQRDETAVAGLYADTAIRIEKCVQGVLERMGKEGML